MNETPFIHKLFSLRSVVFDSKSTVISWFLWKKNLFNNHNFRMKINTTLTLCIYKTFKKVECIKFSINIKNPSRPFIFNCQLKYEKIFYHCVLLNVKRSGWLQERRLSHTTTSLSIVLKLVGLSVCRFEWSSNDFMRQSFGGLQCWITYCGKCKLFFF